MDSAIFFHDVEQLGVLLYCQLDALLLHFGEALDALGVQVGDGFHNFGLLCFYCRCLFRCHVSSLGTSSMLQDVLQCSMK